MSVLKFLPGPMRDAIYPRDGEPQWDAAQQIVQFPVGCVPALRLKPKGFDGGDVLVSFDDSYNLILETGQMGTSCYDADRKLLLGRRGIPRGTVVAGPWLRLKVDRFDRSKNLHFESQGLRVHCRLQRKSTGN